MQDARDEVVKVYRSQGMQVEKELNDPEDHLTFELQFLANMCARAREAFAADEGIDELLRVQIDFIEQHIFNWVGNLADKVDEYADSAFYPSVMKVIQGYLVEHRVILDELLEG